MKMDSVLELEGKRITLKRSRPNPLFEGWLEELYEEAKTKKSKLESMLKEALDSLSKYPLPLNSGAECAVLKGFDKKLCLFLDRRVEAYTFNSQLLASDSQTSNSQDATPPNQSDKDETVIKPNKTKKPTKRKNTNRTNENVDTQLQQVNSTESDSSNKKISKTRKEYQPAYRSGSYAILVALLKQMEENPASPALTKDKLIEYAQPHSEESFTRPKPESFYTAWSNMSRLVTKGLVKQVRSKYSEYSLTDEGIALAIDIYNKGKKIPTANDIIFNGDSSSIEVGNGREMPTLESTNPSSQSSQPSTATLSQRTVSDLKFVELPADSFDVILLIDKQEISGNRNKNDPTVAQFNKYPDLKHEYRSLKVGDFTWIARHKVNKEELVLPYIVERKRMDDFGKSVIDGRFHEQKFRLRKCGLKNVLYLVEHFGSNKHVGLPIQSLMQALANTRVQDGFKVHITESLNNTARFLAMMTKRLTIEYQDKSLFGSNSEPEGEQLMIFDYFNKSSTKNKALTVTETFIKLLLQLKGVSVEKALAIVKEYSTPKALLTEYQRCSQKEGEMLLANLKYGSVSRNVGPMVSKAIHKFFVWEQ